MSIFRRGDRVVMKVGEIEYVGEVTIVREEDDFCKVIFDDGDGPDYWYYPASSLTLVSPDYKAAQE